MWVTEFIFCNIYFIFYKSENLTWVVSPFKRIISQVVLAKIDINFEKNGVVFLPNSMLKN